MLTLTETAVSEVKKFIEAENPGAEAGLRIRVVPGGCSGFSYSMQIEDGPRPGDDIIDEQGLRVFVDMFSLIFHRCSTGANPFGKSASFR